MNITIGLDLGSKTLGVAISTSGIIASILDTYRFAENDYQQAVMIVTKVIDEHQVTHVVLGYPKHMNNDVGIRGKISEDFKRLIELARPVEVILWDERLSTKTANQAMIKGDVRRHDRKQKKDSLAAVVILQNYLDHKGANKHA